MHPSDAYSDGRVSHRFRAVALLVGAALYALALPPYDVTVAGWVAVTPLLLAVRGLRWREAAVIGLLQGAMCAWAVGMYLAQALGRYFMLGYPLAIVAASGYAFVVWGTAFALFAVGAASLMRRRWTPFTSLALAALWVGTELYRVRVLEQPWGLLGYTQYTQVSLIQISAITGVYGVSFLLALSSAAVAHLITHFVTRAAPLWPRSLSLAILLLLASWSIGAFVIRRPGSTLDATAPIAIVQANVPPSVEWTRAYTERQVDAHLRATESLLETSRPALIAWPENSVPLYLEREPLLARRLHEMATRSGADILLGGPRFADGHIYNSIRLISGQAQPDSTYDKKQLVLFGETELFSGTEPVAQSGSPRSFSSGRGPRLLRSFTPLGVSICHELIYPHFIAQSVWRGARLLVNVSNDGWLDAGNGIASRQHFAMGVFRAVETRRWLVRAALTGVSGVVDPYGRIRESLPAGTSAVLNTQVAPVAVRTAYVVLGDFFALLCALLALTALVAGRRVTEERAVPAPAWIPKPAA